MNEGMDPNKMEAEKCSQPENKQQRWKLKGILNDAAILYHKGDQEIEMPDWSEIRNMSI